MVSQEESDFYFIIKQSISKHPEWLMSAMQAIQSGLSQRLTEEQHQRAEWETIAFNAMESRIFKNNKSWLAQKIDRLRGSAFFKWDHIIEKLEASK